MVSEKSQNDQPGGRFQNLHKVTPLSKYLAMVLFVMLPFIGGWIGYTYVPGKVSVIEKTVEVEKFDKSKNFNESAQNFSKSKNIDEIINNSPVMIPGCNNQIFENKESELLAGFLGLQLPTFQGHSWFETSAGHGSGIWQACENDSSWSTGTISIFKDNYLIPDGCNATLDADGRDLVCTNPDTQVLWNDGSQAFAELLLTRHQQNETLTFLEELDSIVPAHLFLGEDMYYVVIQGPKNSFVIRFNRTQYDKNLVTLYVQNITLSKNI